MKFETKISWVMTHHMNKIFHSEKSDQAPLISYIDNLSANHIKILKREVFKKQILQFK